MCIFISRVESESDIFEILGLIKESNRCSGSRIAPLAKESVTPSWQSSASRMPGVGHMYPVTIHKASYRRLSMGQK